MAVKALLDTHTLLWWLFDDPKLSNDARNYITNGDNHLVFSSASAWEISIKYKLGKLPKIGDVIDNLSEYLRHERIAILPISLEHALLAGNLPEHHKDPFDRMLAAQAKIENMILISTDLIFTSYGIKTIW